MSNRQTQQHPRGAPEQQQGAGLPCFVLEHLQPDEPSVEEAGEGLNGRHELLESEVVSVVAEEKPGENEQIGGVGDVHYDEKEDGEGDGGVVHEVGHWGRFYHEAAQVVPVRGYR